MRAVERHPSFDSTFIRACRGLPVTHTPVWLMRQAGRYMSEYREMRARVSFLELCRSPDLVAETTVFAQERIGADAAIVFSDLLLVLEAMGLDLSYPKGGPRLSPPVRSASDVDQLEEVQARERLAYVYAGIRATRAALAETVPLIGFAGAPFTLAAYACEGGPSRSFVHTKSLMYRDPGAWSALMEKLVRGLIEYLCCQAEAGAQCLQIFDSWVGAVGPEDYRDFVAPHSTALINGVKAVHPDVPIIHFGTGTGQILEQIQAAGGDVIGVDYQTSFAQARSRLGDEQPVQGNLEPLVLYSSPEYVCERAQRVIDANAGRTGHIFNLGHGILPETPVDNVIRLIDYVHEATATSSS
ncbi:MAG TPA: uroporphyrinogen decarboxylase [Deltaproteobacteria bacterium]|nr:uroporphyrinogen decarboxylase [Deltaproteobacteria bacterium]HCP45674.1 uroporphyrinogen decarboxylase [Deltaproteobacteria bacterium]